MKCWKPWFGLCLSLEGWLYQRACDAFVSGLDGCSSVGERGLLSSGHLSSNRGDNETFFVNMSTPTILEVTVFFHCFSVFNDELEKNTLTVPHDYCTGTLINVCVQHLIMVLRELSGTPPSTGSSEAVSPYMLFDNGVCQLQVLAVLSNSTVYQCYRHIKFRWLSPVLW